MIFLQFYEAKLNLDKRYDCSSQYNIFSLWPNTFLSLSLSHSIVFPISFTSKAVSVYPGVSRSYKGLMGEVF
jgi:hypothetical protein